MRALIFLVAACCIFADDGILSNRSDDEEALPSPNETWALWQRLSQYNTMQMERKRQRKQSKRKKVFDQNPMFEDLEIKISTERKGGETEKVNQVLGYAVVTKSKIRLNRKTHLEVSGYKGGKPGLFNKASGFHMIKGRFTSPYTGVYNFYASAKLSVPKFTLDIARKDYVTLLVCIDGDCTDNAALSSVDTFRHNMKTVTLQTNGYLHIQAGQYVSVFLDNNSNRYNFTLQRDAAYFSGIYIGV